MKVVILSFFAIVTTVCSAATASWSGFWITRGSHAYDEWHTYDLYAEVQSDSGARGKVEAMLYEHEEGTDFFLKSFDYSTTMANVRSSMVLAFIGDILSEETFDSAIKLALCSYGDTAEGGTLIEDRSNFYLGFMTSEDGVSDGQKWYGWIHVSIDDQKNMNILSSGIGLNGEGVIVGGGSATPEPSSGLLILLGGALLMLRRRG